MITQNNARKAEKALKEILDKADSNLNGKVGLEEFIQIIEINGVEVNFFQSISVIQKNYNQIRC